MKISVITATYNAAKDLPTLIKSLRDQTDREFEWVIADGQSTDTTLALLAEINDLNIVVDSEPDFGIYDALNRGIKKSRSEFYLVLGADDYLYPDAIENFKKEVINKVDVIAARIKTSKGVLIPSRGKPWLRGQAAFVANHAVGTLFRKSLHDEFGYYSRKFPIAADQLFIKSIYRSSISVSEPNFVAGYFNNCGVSNTDVAGSITEFFRTQLLTEKYTSVQFVLCFLRLLKNIRKFNS